MVNVPLPCSGMTVYSGSAPASLWMVVRIEDVTWSNEESRDPRSICMHCLTLDAIASGPGVRRRAALGIGCAFIGFHFRTGCGRGSAFIATCLASEVRCQTCLFTDGSGRTAQSRRRGIPNVRARSAIPAVLGWHMHRASDRLIQATGGLKSSAEVPAIQGGRE